MQRVEEERNQDASIYVGNLDPSVNERILYELFLQVAPVKVVKMPKDRVLRTHQGYGFVEFTSIPDAAYVEQVMNGIKLFGRAIRVKRANGDKATSIDVGATLFVGNLNRMIDEKFLFETFSTFGKFVKPPALVRDEINQESKGRAFLYYTTFEASDRVVNEMNNQYLMNQPVRIDYAFKEGSNSEKHGDQVERMLATQARENNVS